MGLQTQENHEQEIEDQIMLEKFYNMKYERSTSEVIDRIDYNRRKLFEMEKTTDTKAYGGMFDKIIVMDIFKKGIDAGRIDKIEEKDLEKEFKEKNYNWEDCRKKLKDVVVQKELKSGNKTNYQENDVNYVDRNQRGNSGRFNRLGRFDRQGRNRSRSSYKGNHTERFRNQKDGQFYRSRSQGGTYIIKT